MKSIWTTIDVDVPADVAFDVFTDLAEWPNWGPSVRAASLDDGPFRAGATGTIETLFGVRLRFEITECTPGRSWSWAVRGIPATKHVVEPIGDHRSRIGFGVPVLAAPYLAVCRVALQRIAATASTRVAS